jgi:hypothetical protein
VAVVVFVAVMVVVVVVQSLLFTSSNLLHIYLGSRAISFVQHESGAASNHVGGSPRSQVGPSQPGSSPGSQARTSQLRRSP